MAIGQVSAISDISEKFWNTFGTLVKQTKSGFDGSCGNQLAANQGSGNGGRRRRGMPTALVLVSDRCSQQLFSQS